MPWMLGILTGASRRLFDYKVSRRHVRFIYALGPRKELTSRTLPMFEYEEFQSRHIGSSEGEAQTMLHSIGYADIKSFMRNVLPRDIPLVTDLNLPSAMGENELTQEAQRYADLNRVGKCYIGQGYYPCYTPAVIQRGILENPGWYTQYTPYQAEISQGRLEGLLNFQTMISELTGLPLSNASLLDEGTAAAEAVTMLYASSDRIKTHLLMDKSIFKHTKACLETRAKTLGLEIQCFDKAQPVDDSGAFAAILQYPDSFGRVREIHEFMKHKPLNLRVIMICDLMALMLLKSPGELGADVAVGTAQRFGLPMGYGGPHPAYLSCKEEHKRRIPGRIVGISKDREGRRALRLSLQTREQHIRREKATSNICTAQALPANVAAMYAVYHGPKGLARIAKRIHLQTSTLAKAIEAVGHQLLNVQFFDTVVYRPREGVSLQEMVQLAKGYNVLLGTIEDEGFISISLNETVTDEDLETLLKIVALEPKETLEDAEAFALLNGDINGDKRFYLADHLLRDRSKLMKQAVFNSYQSETSMMRYIKELERKDLSLVNSIIPLGSCTMKLNAVSEMATMTLSGFAHLHPFCPKEDSLGYQRLLDELEGFLCKLTGFHSFSLQPNSGAQGEYAGLCVIRAFYEQRGEGQRNICLIPESAHGTNPASAAMAGFKVVAVKCSSKGEIDLSHLETLLKEHERSIACMMITFPSTFGLFEERIPEYISKIHRVGGKVYMDGANMNAQLGYCRPAELGFDVCHLNLHKTFCIPHGGGGPGAGPIGVTKELSPFLPGKETSLGPVSSAPFGSASILPISWSFIRMMGSGGLKRCSERAILHANYMVHCLRDHYPILFGNRAGLVAHEFIIDCRAFKQSADVEVLDVAKRLQVNRIRMQSSH